jgi:pimeloyl-ACP methyl ester carboxylesterase
MTPLQRTVERLLGGDGPTTDPESPVLQVADDIARNPKTVTVDDGREVGYADVGDPDGTPLFVFHGFPSSRVFGALFDAVGRERGVRVLAPERPGLGVSTPDPDRALTDWPGDVAAVADALDVETFSVLGISGGGPYSAVTAALLPGRVERAGIACGVAPMASVGLRERLWYYTARAAPLASKLGLWLLSRRALRDREAFLEEMAESAAPADGELWRGEIGKVIHASMVESRRHHGLDPLVRETAIHGRPWGFDLGDIEVPTYLWYGRPDALVPLEMGLYLAKHVPTAEAHVYPDLGHLSVVEHNESEIVDALTGR